MAVIIYNRHLEREWMTQIKNDGQFNNVTGAKEHLSSGMTNYFHRHSNGYSRS